MAKTDATITIKSFLQNIKNIVPDLPKKDVKIILDQFLKLIKDSLIKEQRILLNGLGTFKIRKTKARMGRNPNTGEALKIKATKKIVFRAAAPLKEKVRSKKRL